MRAETVGVSENLPVAVLSRPLKWGELPVGEGDFLLPTGTVTLLLADVDGSARRWEADPEGVGRAIARLNEIVDEQVGRHDGVRPVEQRLGDSFVAAFARARDAVACGLAIQQALAGEPVAVRMGVHTGDVQRRDEGNYTGRAIDRAARIRTLAHGGQTVMSQTTRELVVDALPENAGLSDLGSHQLSDLSRPEHIYQLCHPDLPAVFPPLRSLDARGHNLPVQRTSFVGRIREMAAVKALIADNMLVTLTGAGGCGKSRLAVHAGAELIDTQPDGVWFADLAPVANPDMVAAQVASIFALKAGPSVTPTDGLAAYLGTRTTVLILDNCEHVLDAAAALADTLLARCPCLRVLATSRQPLVLEGELTWRVPSLTVPEDAPADPRGGVCL